MPTRLFAILTLVAISQSCKTYEAGEGSNGGQGGNINFIQPNVQLQPEGPVGPEQKETILKSLTKVDAAIKSLDEEISVPSLDQLYNTLKQILPLNAPYRYRRAHENLIAATARLRAHLASNPSEDPNNSSDMFKAQQEGNLFTGAVMELYATAGDYGIDTKQFLPGQE